VSTIVFKPLCVELIITDSRDGLSTAVGANGCMLSGGQRQRIAIARALLRNPKVLLLDEATSALDSHSEAEIIQALRVNGAARTTVLVTHRLRSVIHADVIFMLEDGAVIEQGTHKELTELRGKYYRFSKLQSI
jgi:ABC-type multidrug transport system fused ATPase/permease subunit